MSEKGCDFWKFLIPWLHASRYRKAKGRVFKNDGDHVAFNVHFGMAIGFALFGPSFQKFECILGEVQSRDVEQVFFSSIALQEPVVRGLRSLIFVEVHPDVLPFALAIALLDDPFITTFIPIYMFEHASIQKRKDIHYHTRGFSK